jgi:hypothetical protein
MPVARRVILDECLPHDLRHALAGFRVETAAYAKVAGLTNGRLLDAIQGRLDVLVTVDSSLSYQQNLSGRGLAIVVLHAVTNRIEDLRPLLPALLSALNSIKSEEITHV